MNPRWLDGPDEPQEWPCQADGCVDGQVPARKFDKHGPTDCDECGGTGVIDIDPDDFLDPDRDDTLLYDDIEMDYGRGWAE